MFSVARTVYFFFQAEDGIRDYKVTGVQTCALPILSRISRSNRPKVLGLVSIRAAVRGESLDSRSARLIRPSSPERTSITWKPLRAALAGFVPWAESGTRTSVRFS